VDLLKKFITTQGTLSHINGRYIDINNLSTQRYGILDKATLILNLIMILLLMLISRQVSRILRQNKKKQH
jgi:hypothetical protein